MEPALPLKSVVLFIACGTMERAGYGSPITVEPQNKAVRYDTVFIIVFIFAKRQITRFALKSRGPHVAIGSDAPKDLKQEIERRLHRVGDIKFEPVLLPPSLQGDLTTEQGKQLGKQEIERRLHHVGDIKFEPVLLPPSLQGDLTTEQEQVHYLYRMKAIDALAVLDGELQQYSPHIRRRLGQHTLRSFLLEQRQGGPLEGCKLDLIEKFTESYAHARHDPSDFLELQYKEFIELLNQLVAHIRIQKNRKGSTVTKPDIPPCCKEAAPAKPAGVKKADEKEAAKTPSVDNGTAVLSPEVQVTYRPGVVDRSAGVLQMTPSATGSSGSSLVDAGSTEAPSNPSSARSSRSSGHFETPV